MNTDLTIEPNDSTLDFDLNSLAEQYQNKKSISPVGLTILQRNNPDLDSNSGKPLSSSIDKLLDNFFSKNFEEATPTPTNNKNFDFDFNTANDNTLKSAKKEDEDQEFDLNSILAQRTQSINIDKKPQTETADNVGFSLNDLANEYLTSNTPVSTTSNLLGKTPTDGNKTDSQATSLMDLIGTELMDGQSVGSVDFDLESEMQKIDFSTEDLLINKKKQPAGSEDLSDRLSSSLTLKPNLLGNLNDKRRNSYHTEGLLNNASDKINCRRCPNAKLENFAFIECKDQGQSADDLLGEVHHLNSQSLFGEFLACDDELNKSSVVNVTNDFFEVQFAITSQKAFLKQKRSNEKRRRITVECLGKHERRLKYKLAKENESPAGTAQVNQSSGRLHKNSVSSQRSKRSGRHGGKDSPPKNRVLIFDFSIPSPDDIVIAKQKFAFKNMRYK